MKGMYPNGAWTAPQDRDAFDPEAARLRMGVDRKDFARIFEYIWREVRERRSRLDDAWQAGDWKAVALHAHTVKSSAAAIGAEGLRRAAEGVERAAEAGDAIALEAALRTFHTARELLARLVGVNF